MADKNKKKKFSLKKLIYNDKYLIVFSIIAAVIVWVSTSMSLSPETTKTITVAVNVDFSDSAADQLGIKCYGDSKIDVDVTVKCKNILQGILQPMTLRFSFKLIQSLQKVIMMFLLM